METKLDSIKSTLRHTLPTGGRAWLYGSRARGDARIDSDWDILVVIDKDSLSLDDYAKITYPLTALGWDLGEEINPVLYSRKEWDDSLHTPFRENVERDAISLCS